MHPKGIEEIKTRLEKEIGKYDRRLSKNFLKPTKKATVMRGSQKHGTKCLRTLMLEIEMRRLALAKFRPNLADKICGIPSQKKADVSV